MEEMKDVNGQPLLRRINHHDCRDCARKHLSSAIVELGELQRGYWGTDHEIYAMGNLNEACEHIQTLLPEAADALRLLRVDIFDAAKRVEPRHISEAIRVYWLIAGRPDASQNKIGRTASNEPVQARPIITNIPALKRPCCGKRVDSNAPSQIMG